MRRPAPIPELINWRGAEGPATSLEEHPSTKKKKRRSVIFQFLGISKLISSLVFAGPVFNYNRAIHNVVVVPRSAYLSCTTPRGAKVYQTGNDKIKLVRGQNYFICNFPGHCEAGMKIAVTAT